MEAKIDPQGLSGRVEACSGRRRKIALPEPIPSCQQQTAQFNGPIRHNRSFSKNPINPLLDGKGSKKGVRWTDAVSCGVNIGKQSFDDKATWKPSVLTTRLLSINNHDPGHCLIQYP
ncbi:MAG: hypothetical protein Q4D91_13925 [Lautropia sp.]|nr:hypothetical protein [Lautropia sp.]